MSITLKTLVIDGVGTEAKMIVADTAEDFETLKELARKGLANWPNAPASIPQLVAALLGLKIVVQEKKEASTEAADSAEQGEQE